MFARPRNELATLLAVESCATFPVRINHTTLSYNAATPIAHRRDVTQNLLLRDSEINTAVAVCYYATPARGLLLQAVRKLRAAR